MSLRILSVEFLKIRRKMIWFLVMLGPAGVIGLQAVNFGLRYDYLMKQFAADPWGGVIGNVNGLMVPALFMGLAIVASMSAGIEHQTNAWKLTLALPVTKIQVFLGKFLLTSILLAVASLLTAAGTIVLGLALGLNPVELPIDTLAVQMFYPYLAVMPFIALQVWLSAVMPNQAVPLTVGIAGTVVSMFGAYRFGDWVPWKWPYLLNAANEPLLSAGLGLATGAVVLAVGLADFVRKDVK